MAEQDIKSLENENNWDFTRAERRSGNRGVRTILSVAFSREDFDRISTSAELSNERVSEFVRTAALERVQRLDRGTTLAAVSESGWRIITSTAGTVGPPSTTRVSGANTLPELKAVLAQSAPDVI